MRNRIIRKHKGAALENGLLSKSELKIWTNEGLVKFSVTRQQTQYAIIVNN